METGHAFLNKPTRAVPVHLWVIISDVQQDASNVVIVNLTTKMDHHDQTCILAEDDHPWIRHDSCVNYPEAKITSISALEDLLDKNLITPQEPFSDAVVDRIRIGADETEELRNAVRVLLRRQGLVE